MSNATEIRDAVKALSGFNELRYESAACIVSEVTDIDCTCDPIDGTARLFNILFNANNTDGFKLIPQSGSVVIVSLTSNTTGYVSMVSSVDKVYLAGDEHGGVVIVQDLVTKLNALENDLNTLKQAFTSWVVAPGDGGLALKAISAAWAGTSIANTTVNDLENDKVVHGSS